MDDILLVPDNGKNWPIEAWWPVARLAEQGRLDQVRTVAKCVRGAVIAAVMVEGWHLDHPEPVGGKPRRVAFHRTDRPVPPEVYALPVPYRVQNAQLWKAP